MSRTLEVIAAPDKPTIVTRRELDAPRALVFEAWTTPEHMRRWMGPRAVTWTTCEVDLRVGGRYRWVQRAPDGREYAFHGVYREIAPPERLVGTFVFDAFPKDEAVETLTLQDHGGNTIAITHTEHRTMEGRDAHLAGGRMAAGMIEGYERLDELLAALGRERAR